MMAGQRITITVVENRYCNAASLDIELLSPVFDSYEARRQFFAIVPINGEQRRISGWSTERGGIVAALRCAKAKVLSGEYKDKTGFLLWSNGDGGIAIGGADGWGEPCRFFETLEGFPEKIVKAIKAEEVKV